MNILSKTLLGVIGVVSIVAASAASARVFVNVGLGSYYAPEPRVVSVMPAQPVVYVSEPRYDRWNRYDRRDYYSEGGYYSDRYHHHHHHHREYYR